MLFSLIPKKKSGKIYMGAIYGFAYGIVILFCILVPFSAYLEIAEDALPATKGMEFMDEQTYSTLEKPVTELNSSFVFKLHRTLGGKLATNSLTKINLTIGDEKINTTLAPELSSILKFSNDAIALAKTPMNRYTETHTAALSSLASSLPESKLLSVTASEFIFLATDAWNRGETFMMIPKPSINKDFDPVIDKCFIILNADAKNLDYLCEDINTLADILFNIVSSNALSGETGLASALTAEGLVRDLLTEINENERMRSLIPIVTNIGLKMVAEKLGIPENGTEAFKTLTEDISAELVYVIEGGSSLEIRAQYMENTITESLEKLNVSTVSDTETIIIAMALASNFRSTASATPENVAEFLNALATSTLSDSDSEVGSAPVIASGSYGTLPLLSSNSAAFATEVGALLYEICETQNNSSLTPEQKAERISQLILASTLNTDDYNTYLHIQNNVLPKLTEDALNRTGQDAKNSLNTVIGLGDAKEHASFNVTVENLLVDTRVFDDSNAVPEEEMQGIIDAIANIFENSATLINGDIVEGDIDTICVSLGRILDSLNVSDSFYGEEKTEKLLSAILKSDVMKKKTGISSTDIDTMIRKRNENSITYVALMTSVSKTTVILDTVTNGGEITDTQVSDLITSLTTENSGEVIATVITENRLKQTGFASETNSGNAEASASLLRDVFTNVSNVTDETEHEAEVGAVKQLIEIAVDAKNNTDTTKNAFGEQGRLGCTAGEIIDNLLTSSSVCKALNESELVGNPFGIKLTLNDQIAFIADYNDRVGSADEETAQTLYNIAVFFGIIETV